MSNMDLPRSPVANTAMGLAMTEALSTETTDEAKALFTRTAGFDPAEYIDNMMNEPTLKQRLMASLSWRLDNKIVGACVQMYNAIALELSENHPNMSLGEQIEAVSANVRGQRELEQYWGDGVASRLVNLVSLQHDWHQRADRLMILAGMQPEPYSKEFDFTQRIMNATAGDVRGMTMANFKLMAEEEASEAPESERQAVYDAALAQYKANAEARVTDILAKRKARVDALRAIYVEALHMAPDDGMAYDRLDIQTRLDFTIQLRLKAIALKEQLAPRMETGSFMIVMRDTRDLVKTLDRVADKLARDLMAQTSAFE